MSATVGVVLGTVVGLALGPVVGAYVSPGCVGAIEGLPVGAVGLCVGLAVGFDEGAADGLCVGLPEGKFLASDVFLQSTMSLLALMSLNPNLHVPISAFISVNVRLGFAEILSHSL